MDESACVRENVGQPVPIPPRRASNPGLWSRNGTDLYWLFGQGSSGLRSLRSPHPPPRVNPRASAGRLHTCRFVKGANTFWEDCCSLPPSFSVSLFPASLQGYYQLPVFGLTYPCYRRSLDPGYCADACSLSLPWHLALHRCPCLWL